MQKQSLNKRVALGMSGGVDSSVAAYLLKKDGYDVVGVYMQCWDAKADGCKAEEDRSDAVQVAAKLNIPFLSLDFINEYRDRVIKYFYQEYKSGRTPNPDVLCNKEIKFGMFLEWALSEGFDYVATGHYARVVKEGKNFKLYKGLDVTKDQSYFLYLLGQNELSKTLFPLGDLEKIEIRKIAADLGLHNASKPDSVGICFIGEVDIKEFLMKEIKAEVGRVVNIKGEVLGDHDGVWFYTIGQRHGFRIHKYVGLPLYVIGKNVESNELIVGFMGEVNRQNFNVENIHWVGEIPDLPLNCDVRIRHLGEMYSCTVNSGFSIDGTVESADPTNPDALSNPSNPSNPVLQLNVALSEEIFGVAPGQSAVFYVGDELIGGGVIA